MTPARPSPAPGGARAAVLTLAVLLLAVPALGGCARSVGGVARVADAGATPDSPEELGRLVVTDVASGLPRLPDDELDPPAGEKSVDDVARYADDPAHERTVLEDYGYRFGWERFWGTGSGPTTSVFLDQFRDWSGARAYARDLAGNDAEHYRGMLRPDPPGLPGGCWLLTVEKGHTQNGLTGPAAFAWCAYGVFSVSVTAIADTSAAAAAEVHAVLHAQLERLPPR